MNIGIFFLENTKHYDSYIRTQASDMKVEILQIFFSQKELANCFAILDLNIILISMKNNAPNKQRFVTYTRAYF